MAKYKLENIVPKTWNDKHFFEATLIDEASNFSEKVSAWNGEITEGMTEIDCELYKNAKGYWAISAPKKTGGAGIARSMEVKATNIAVAQDKKAQNIAQAQDRSAWMWAKYSASELYIHLNPSATNMDSNEEAVSKINELATSIYHLEPTPFN